MGQLPEGEFAVQNRQVAVVHACDQRRLKAMSRRLQILGPGQGRERPKLHDLCNTTSMAPKGRLGFNGENRQDGTQTPDRILRA